MIDVFVFDLFDLVEWVFVFGVEDYIDIIVYVLCDGGVVCIVFNWLEVCNVFCLYIVDELYCVFDIV